MMSTSLKLRVITGESFGSWFDSIHVKPSRDFAEPMIWSAYMPN